MDYKKLLTGLLSRAYKMDEGRITEVLKEDSDEATVLADLLIEDQNRVAKLKPKEGEDGTSKFQEGYKKAKKEVREAFEKELKEEYGIESDLQGKDLVDHIVQAKAGEATKGKKGAAELTEDDIKALPVYRQAEKAWKKQLADKEAELETKLKEAEEGFVKKETIGTFKEEALKELAGLKPILSKDENKARNQRETFAKMLIAEGLEVRKEDGGFVLLKNGKVLDDGHGNSIDWKDYVKTKASDYFDFEANNGGANAGNSNEQDPKGGKNNASGKKEYPAGIPKPANFDEYSKAVQNREYPLADRQALQAAWSEDNGRTE